MTLEPAMRAVPIALIASALALGGCAEHLATDAERSFAGPGIGLAVAPLGYDGAEDACYALTVAAGAETVWSVRNICGAQFGHKAEIFYVGPCDATAGPHTVTLEVEALCSGHPTCGTFDEATGWSHDDDDYVNPCPAPGGCVRTGVACQQDADTLVTFDLTFLRQANQGFFDVAVNFADLFCSAKLDCESASGDAIHLLHHPETGQRDTTAVLAVACARAGGEGAGTVLHMDPIEVVCEDDVRMLLDPTVGPGNAWTGAPADPEAPVWQYAVYRGGEAVDCAGGSCEKVYWNVAIGYDVDAHGCRLRTSATASAPDAMEDGLTPEGATYPLIAIDVALTGATGGRVCEEHPLDGADGGVMATYAALDARRRFCHRFDGAEASTPNGGAHGCAYPQAPVLLTPPPDGVTCVGMACEDVTTKEGWLPEATFYQGCNQNLDANCNLERELAQRPVNLSPYYIDKHPVTAAEYEACVVAGVCTIPPVETPARYTYGDPDRHDHPITHINFDRASTYCAWAGKPAGAQRLCTEAEWEHAARGGCDTVTGDCAAHMRVHAWDAGDGSPPIPATCERANVRIASNPNVFCEPDGNGNTSSVTSRPLGASPYGVLEMTGNVFEWTSDWFVQGYPEGEVTDPQGPESSPTGGRIVRGGSFRNDIVRASQRNWSLPHQNYDYLGVRCCRTP